MMHEEELKDKCALCGRLLSRGSDDSTAGNLIIKEIIQNTDYKFDTRECVTMFKRFLDVYGNQFQPFLGDKQYISDPFWNKVLPKEDEIKEIREQEKADQKMSTGVEDNYTQRKNAAKNEKLEVVSLIKDSIEVQKLIVQLIKSAQEDIALAVPTTATDIFFSSQAQETSSYTTSSSFSCSVFFQLIKDLALDNKKLNVRIVTNAKRLKKERGQDTQDILSNLRQNEDLPNIHVKYIEQDYSSLNENMVILVVGRSASLAIELEEKDERQQEGRGELEYKRGSSYKMIKLATYSNNKSTVLSYISIFESLWKEIELNEKITAILEEIKRRENIERDFISMAAHELRTPIQPVLGLAQILQSKKVDTKEQEELLSVIIRNARRLNILTENLLDLAKIESKTLNLQKETFSIPEMIFDAISDMKSQLSSHQVTVNIEYNDGSAKDIQEDIINDISGKIMDRGGDAFLVEADKTRIMQVISNLLANAIKFTEKGKIVIGLHNPNAASQKEEGGQAGEREVIVSFKDSGTGIDPEMKDKLFEKFATKSDKGTGLGLFICKNIIEAHGGRIWAKNNPEGKGATFAFSLPKLKNLLR
ncbi:MAG TPA: HAMP domain-containing sensor histidine kinase [Nitrososphaeraceae archaeon]|nr:HAMP domain-containing sensor histidine kinase [Nitrososphaeraceae archaeon]